MKKDENVQLCGTEAEFTFWCLGTVPKALWALM